MVFCFGSPSRLIHYICIHIYIYIYITGLLTLNQYIFWFLRNFPYFFLYLQGLVFVLSEDPN